MLPPCDHNACAICLQKELERRDAQLAMEKSRSAALERALEKLEKAMQERGKSPTDP